MTSTEQPYGDRAPLCIGDIVYFVDGESIVGSGNLTVKKAMVTSTDYIGLPNDLMHAPAVSVWDRVDVDPESEGIFLEIPKPAHELFTEDEVLQAIACDEGQLRIDARPVDEIIDDHVARKELTVVLGCMTMSRLAEDEFKHFGNLD